MTAARLKAWETRHNVCPNVHTKQARNLNSINWMKAYLEAKQQGREVRLMRPTYER